ncbi:serine hydrolase [Phyllobacterium sp. YR531]|uniref:serine hydrolase domain-containing protein n=1 Tax=Phyllobacterium sp. YR531 TaxID=1144343 RepID=UPI00026F52DC|nr:serine hydrolase [Phyllobacterium sp. YR531]EJM98699.1 penicillin-binding protein, beta-lactamase class C [Phyllobacterium sp. YR531]
MANQIVDRRTFILGSMAGGACLLAPSRSHAQAPQSIKPLDGVAISRIIDQASAFPALQTMIVYAGGKTQIEHRFHGPAADRPVNVKSVSKTIIATLAGIAIDRKVFSGLGELVAPILSNKLPQERDPRLAQVTLGNLLSMQAGLDRTSGPNYGRWVESSDWVRYALARDFVDEPGGRMLYSTGNSHLISAMLTRKTGRSTLENAREWLGEPLGINVPAWPRDPQGIYFGGNDMELSPRAMLTFGKMFLDEGRSGNRQIVPAAWIAESWKPRTSSPFTGDSYGLGWFISYTPDGKPFYYAWGYGGQMIYVVPHAAVVAVMTSNTAAPSGRSGYVRQLHNLLATQIVPAAEAAIG